MVGLQQGQHARAIEFAAVGIDAPIIDRDGQIEQPDATAGKVKIDDTADMVALEQDIVAKQVRVNGSSRQALELSAANEAVLEDDFLGQLLELVFRNQRLELGKRTFPPADSAQVGLGQREIACLLVHFGQEFSNLRALGCAWVLGRASRQSRDDGDRFAARLAEQTALVISGWFRHRQTALRQMLHQTQIKRKLSGPEPLENRQHELAIGGRQEKIGVLDARRDAFEVDQPADRITVEQRSDFVARQRGEHGHDASCDEKLGRRQKSILKKRGTDSSGCGCSTEPGSWPSRWIIV